MTRSYHAPQVAPWIFQWCHSGSYDPLLSQDPHHAADHGDLAAAITLGADYGTPAVPLVHHWGHGFVKEVPPWSHAARKLQLTIDRLATHVTD